MSVTWRSVNYLSCLISALLNALWLLLFWNVWGLRNAWFAIMIDLGQLFAFSINSMLVRLVVVELALPGKPNLMVNRYMNALWFACHDCNAGDSLPSIELVALCSYNVLAKLK